MYVAVMSCVKVILNNRQPESIHNTVFIIVTHLICGAFVRKCIVNYSYCDHTALIRTYVHEIITLIINIEIS